jgi:glutamate synthase domain-containing protein 2
MVTAAPDLDRRIATYKKYHRGFGEILVQMNVEDTRLGVAEYVIEKHGLDTIELKWGQGAKCIGGEIKVNSLERALELQNRGYIVTPDPSDPINQAAFKSGAIKEFERHSRLGFVDEEGFMAEVERLRGLGFKRVTLKTGAYGLRELAMAMKWTGKAKIDLLTIDGAPGGTGMSPWRMMQEWGVPAIYLHSAAIEFADKLTAKGERVPDLALAGGFSTEDHIFKALALGAPYVKAICMGRALMIPGMVGKNIAEWLKNGDLPKTVSEFGSTPEEIFVCWEQVADLVGRDEMPNIPLGAVGIYSYANKLQVGLQQLMAGARCFSIPSISRKELMSLTKDCAEVTGIPYVMDSYREEAEAILNG